MIEAKRKVIEHCEELIEKAKTADISEAIIKKLSSIEDDARQRILVVPVVGAFSTGKSTMINGILGENILPVDMAPETSLATELHYSPESFIYAVKETGEVDRYQADEIVKVSANAVKYQYAQLYLKNERLTEIEPLVLVDMPGFDSTLDLHNKAIMAYLDRGCHYIVLSSVEEGTITKSLERRLREIEGYGRSFSLFLSKANLRSKESVNELLSHYQGQIADMFDIKTPVVPLYEMSSEEVIRQLKSIDVNTIFLKQYRDWLLDSCNDIITSICLQVSASRKDAEAIRAAVKEMEESIVKLRKKASSDMEDMAQRYSGAFINEVISDIGGALDGALEELIAIATTGKQEELIRQLNEIVRATLTVSIREKIDGLNKQIALDFSDSLHSLDEVMKNLDFDENYLKNMIEKVEATLTILDNVISGNRFSENPLDNLPIGKGPLNAGYKVLAGVGLSLTTINPIIGIVILFLPDILGALSNIFSGIAKEKQKEALRTKFSGEVFPSIKRKLRTEIPVILDGQIKNMIMIVSEQFEEQIKKQSEIINAQITQKNDSKTAAEERQQKLETVRADVQSITSAIIAWGK